MKRADFLIAGFVLLLFLPFILSDELLKFYLTINRQHGMVMGFIKFAILATLGEMIALRIRKGVYNEPGFGIIPRMIVWGMLGIAINAAFQIFGSGAPMLLSYLGISEAPQGMQDDWSVIKLLDAFTISATMNLTFAPVMMTVHKISDTHILQTGGTVRGFFSQVSTGKILQQIDWDVMWNFVFKKTIPFFWIPAHTITFLLPAETRVLFAALLGIALGLILALASIKKQK